MKPLVYCLAVLAASGLIVIGFLWQRPVADETPTHSLEFERGNIQALGQEYPGAFTIRSIAGNKPIRDLIQLHYKYALPDPHGDYEITVHRIRDWTTKGGQVLLSTMGTPELIQKFKIPGDQVRGTGSLQYEVQNPKEGYLFQISLTKSDDPNWTAISDVIMPTFVGESDVNKMQPVRLNLTTQKPGDPMSHSP